MNIQNRLLRHITNAAAIFTLFVAREDRAPGPHGLPYVAHQCVAHDPFAVLMGALQPILDVRKAKSGLYCYAKEKAGWKAGLKQHTFSD